MNHRTPRLLLPLSALGFALACSGGAEPSEAERLEQRLDRTAVHFHLSLRAALDGDDGAAVARQLIEASRTRDVAGRIAQAHFADRARGARLLREGRRFDGTLSELVAPETEVPGDIDGAAFFLALLAETAAEDGRIPKQVLVYEATRLSLDGTPPVVRALAEAGRALVMARAGYCERSAAEAERALGRELSEAEVRREVARWLDEEAFGEGRLEPARLYADVTRAVSVLAGAARACCGVRDGENTTATRSINRWIDDASELGVSDSKTAILRAWTALVREDRDAARGELAVLRERELGPDDTSRYRMIRDAVASSSREALDDATEQLVDRRWLSALALSGVADAFSEDGLLAALDAHPAAGGLRRLAAGEVAVIAAARARYPMFDQAHQGDKTALDRLAELFR